MADSAAEVLILSKRIVRPTQPLAASSDRRRQIHLTPWDLHLLSADYIQKGILLPRPATAFSGNGDLIDRLLSSFSLALDLFYPLAGRLSTVHHPTTPPSLSILLDCNNAGAEFIHASATGVVSSDITSSPHIPLVVRSFFPLNYAVGHDGHSIPLFSAQVTELADGGIFISCSLNHSVADGASFWHFFNTWSSLSCDAAATVSPPVVDRWFLPTTPPPISLPYSDRTEFIFRDPLPPGKEVFLHFSRRAIADLKNRANEEISSSEISISISSLQALLAHVWRAVTRARGLDAHQETTYVVITGFRRRVTPALPETYLGNALIGSPATAMVGDLAGKGLGWAARRLNEAVAAQTEEAARGWLELWVKMPKMMRVGEMKDRVLVTGSSPRFDVYGNDFGWGSPTAVRSGWGNKMDGKVTVYPGREREGSMGLEICLSPPAIDALLEDKEFMEAVNV